MIDVRIDSRIPHEVLTQVEATLGSLRPLLNELGKAMTVEVRAHFVQRDSEGNRRGWSPRAFWLREGRDNTHLSAVTEDGATVRIASAPIGHKLKGGTITPKRGRMLAIPLREEAYLKGKPTSWDNGQLFAVKKRNGRVFLVVKQGDSLRIMYVLVPKVNQDKDPRTLPDLDKLADQLGDRAVGFLAKVKRRHGG